MGAIVLGSATGVQLKTLRHVGLAYRMPRVPHCPPPLLLLHYSTRPTSVRLPMIYVFVKTAEIPGRFTAASSGSQSWGVAFLRL